MNVHVNTIWEEPVYNESDFPSNDKSSSALIDNIVLVHHAYLRNVLPELYALTQNTGLVYGPCRPVLYEVAGLFKELKDELEKHLDLEERFAFPHIKACESKASEENFAAAGKAIADLKKQNETALELLKRIRKLTDDYTLPVDAGQTYRLTFMKLKELENELNEYIQLENRILFPRFTH